MADIQSLEQRLESISVQDENYDSNAPAAQHKGKVEITHTNHCKSVQSLTDATTSSRPSALLHPPLRKAVSNSRSRNYHPTPQPTNLTQPNKPTPSQPSQRSPSRHKPHNNNSAPQPQTPTPTAPRPRTATPSRSPNNRPSPNNSTSECSKSASPSAKASSAASTSPANAAPTLSAR